MSKNCEIVRQCRMQKDEMHGRKNERQSSNKSDSDKWRMRT